MLIQFMSDLHISNWINQECPNFWDKTFPEYTQTDADVLVLAGDIVSWTPERFNWSVDRLSEFAARYKNIVYVPGNHEFWGTSIMAGLDLLCKAEVQIPGFYALGLKHSVTIKGQRFVGGTLWQPHQGRFYDVANKPFIDSYYINDFETEAEAQYEALRDHFQTELNPSDIVVTHHAPSFGSLDMQWAGHPGNRFFITPEMEPIIDKFMPQIWSHGHVHTPFDYWREATRIICNPHGYPGEGVRFDPQLVLEVP